MKRWIVAFGLIGVLAIALASQFGLAHAAPRLAPATPDPTVDALRDVTGPSCVKKLTVGIGTPRVSVVHESCDPYSVLEILTMRRSQAIVLGYPYVIRPSTGADQASWTEEQRQLQQLVSALRTSARGHVHALSLAPATCTDGGQNHQVWEETSMNGDVVDVWVNYQVSYTCNNVVFQEADILGHTAPAPLFVNDSSYTGGWPNPTWFWGCAFVGTNHLVHDLYGTVAPIGQDFWTKFSSSDAAGCNSTQPAWTIDLEPIS